MGGARSQGCPRKSWNPRAVVAPGRGGGAAARRHAHGRRNRDRLGEVACRLDSGLGPPEPAGAGPERPREHPLQAIRSLSRADEGPGRRPIGRLGSTRARGRSADRRRGGRRRRRSLRQAVGPRIRRRRPFEPGLPPARHARLPRALGQAVAGPGDGGDGRIPFLPRRFRRERGGDGAPPPAPRRPLRGLSGRGLPLGDQRRPRRNRASFPRGLLRPGPGRRTRRIAARTEAPGPVAVPRGRKRAARERRKRPARGGHRPQAAERRRNRETCRSPKSHRDRGQSQNRARRRSRPPRRAAARCEHRGRRTHGRACRGGRANAHIRPFARRSRAGRGDRPRLVGGERLGLRPRDRGIPRRLPSRRQKGPRRLSQVGAAARAGYDERPRTRDRRLGAGRRRRHGLAGHARLFRPADRTSRSRGQTRRRSVHRSGRPAGPVPPLTSRSVHTVAGGDERL